MEARFSRTSAAEEKAERLREQAEDADVYRFKAALIDRAAPIDEGQLVVKIQPHACPRNGTMRMCYVADLTGRFIQMVSLGSLELVERKRRREIR